MPAKTAYAKYQAIRDRLPPEPMGDQSPVTVENLLAIAEQFDVFFFDAYGVLNVGNQAIDGAIEAVSQLQAQGKSCFVVSNAAGFEKSFYLEKFTKLGYQFSADDIVTSRDALLAALTEYPKKEMRWGLIGPAEHQNDLVEMGIHTIDQDEPEFAQADGFLFLSPHRWNDERQKSFIALLHHHSRPVLLGNPDMIAPLGDRSSIEAGTYILGLENPLYHYVRAFGKPFHSIYDIAAKRLHHQGKDLKHTRTLMLGDTLHTDILGGNAYGIRTALVYGHGFFKGLDYQAYIKDSGITPDYVMPQI
ncbi:HAD-IIA family hydrolase [Suttonella ornithocola]|uniref:HAD hydrolase, family IIA n=1 Tax=Suttonella ornithocola TaxID=279832 RepID=A0A380MMS9_9GAMM|nr:HAD-IIA family hydrolase [Suttonella ornithocola]SUO93935.1 HAD hydrolase, family IIA [Suttonella ornithocola]